jgi:hypothetical protein
MRATALRSTCLPDVYSAGSIAKLVVVPTPAERAECRDPALLRCTVRRAEVKHSVVQRSTTSAASSQSKAAEVSRLPLHIPTKDAWICDDIAGCTEDAHRATRGEARNDRSPTAAPLLLTPLDQTPVHHSLPPSGGLGPRRSLGC